MNSLVHSGQEASIPTVDDGQGVSQWPQPGDRILCKRSQSTVAGSRGLLRAGQIYTVAVREDTPWIKGVRLVEVPTTGRAPFSVSRFIPTMTGDLTPSTAGISALAEMNKNPPVSP